MRLAPTTLGAWMALFALGGCGDDACEAARQRVGAKAERCGASYEVTEITRTDSDAECSDARQDELERLATCYDRLACAGGQMGEADLASLRACLAER